MGKLGPHEGMELELMLKNKKNISLFYSDSEIPDDFIPFLNKKIFKLKTINLKDKNKKIFSYYIIYKPSFSIDAKKLEKTLISSFKNPTIEKERIIGKILGYKDEDINFYIDRIKKQR